VVSEFELDLREVEVLELACKQLDLVAQLEKVVERDGPTTEGSRGQRRLSSVVPELRQARIAASRLLGELRLPSADEVPRTHRSRQAQAAANFRWARTTALREARSGGTSA
jgi:hypothetical protein